MRNRLPSLRAPLAALRQSKPEQGEDVDLKVLQKADGIAFNAAIQDILVHGDSEGRRPSRVPLGTLIERSKTRGGRQYTRFYGRPISWMAACAPAGKRIKRIVERSDSGGNRTLYERK